MEDTRSIAIADISALQSNIKSKGTNSYYYAHKKRENAEIHEWDGNAAPRLLKTQSLAISESTEVMEAIANFAWADGKKLKIKNYEGKTRLFVVSKLNDEISDVKIKRKEDQLVLQLVKAKELSWHSLKKEA
ncbi:unnamed protein product [Peronospora destructor]|uniref:CS domain-containing protein n=1 Tax=Peronospora destructor TaxID=86335 RepID=A0AAV0TJB5_9STRA|nr:unnamed protein product [Peronospora destructor]